MDNREPVRLDTWIRDLTTSAGKITIQNTIPPTAPDIIVRSGPVGDTISNICKEYIFSSKNQLHHVLKSENQMFENNVMIIYRTQKDVV